MIITTIAEIKSHINATLSEGVNFWSDSFYYDKYRHTIDDLLAGALRWYHFDKFNRGWKSPNDQRFVKRLKNRMKLFGIDDNVINSVVFKLNDSV